jgi:hypothetical protein
MSKMYLFVIVKGDDKSLKETRHIIDWVGTHLRTINDAGVKINIEKVDSADLTSATITRKLNSNYGITKIPALYVPPSENNPQPSTYNGINSIQKVLEPIILAGQRAARNQLSQIAAPESDYERLLKQGISFEAQKNDNGDDAEINRPLNAMEIQKAASRFNAKKPGVAGNDTTNSAVEEDVRGQKNDNIAVGKGSKQANMPRLPANTRPPMSQVNNKGDVSDDSLMDNFMQNRLGLDTMDL